MLEQLALWVAEQSDSIVTIGEVLGGFSTLAIALLTLLLLRENKALRKAGSEPKVVAHFEVHPDGTGGLNIALSNVGTGPARDVSFSFIADEAEFKNYDIIVDHSVDRPAITLIPQGGKISFLFAIGFQLFRPKGRTEQGGMRPLKPFTINVKWRSLDSKSTYEENYGLDVSQFSGLPGMINKPYLLQAVDSLNGINKQIGSLKPHVQNLVSLIDASVIESQARKRTKGHSESHNIAEKPSGKDDQA